MKIVSMQIEDAKVKILLNEIEEAIKDKNKKIRKKGTYI